jgi:hypothetical protein
MGTISPLNVNRRTRWAGRRRPGSDGASLYMKFCSPGGCDRSNQRGLSPLSAKNILQVDLKENVLRSSLRV